LVPVAERAPQALAAVDALTHLVASSIDLDAVERIARGAPPLALRPWSPRQEMDRLKPATAAAPYCAAAPVIAIASGAAFTFSYAEHAELLAAAGAEIVPFDPLHDEKLPEGVSGLVIGGGFPEVYAPELSANAALRDEVRRLAVSGAVIAAECAGLLYLCESLDGAPMCGVLPASAEMTGRLTLGYREAVAAGDCVLCDAGTRVAGHEFHRSRVEPAVGQQPAWLWRGGKDGFAGPRLHASYLHLHWAGNPSIAHRIVQAAAGPR
jgi:cobyrinic acid a,c-diamide synthase